MSSCFIDVVDDSLDGIYKSLDPVSYTHLDVYKRQKMDILMMLLE